MATPRPVPGPLGADVRRRQISRGRSVVEHPWLMLVLAYGLLVALVGRADPLLALLIGLAFGAAFLSGLVGIGGAVVMIPLLLYVPPLLGLAALDIKTVAGITLVQVAAAAFAGLLGHREGIERRLFLAVGPSMIVASFVGGFVSHAVDSTVLEGVFAGMASVAAVLMLGLRRRTAPEVDSGALSFSRPAAVALGAVVGFVAGLVGAGGAFILVPVMLYGLRIPVRLTVGTSLAVVAASAIAGLAGKMVTGQIAWVLALGLVVGALPGARLGSYVSRRTRTDRLVVVLGVAIAVVALRMWVDILAG